MKSDQKYSSLRVIGGKWRSRKIVFPITSTLRPTSDRVRETLFNWLQGDIIEANCLDLFAGSGACGIEALSRGARSTLFIEKNKISAFAISENLEKLGNTHHRVLNRDSLIWLKENQLHDESKFDIVFIDPPFKDTLIYLSARLLEESDKITAGCKIYIENGQSLELEKLPKNWQLIKQSRAGAVHYFLFVRS